MLLKQLGKEGMAGEVVDGAVLIVHVLVVIDRVLIGDGGAGRVVPDLGDQVGEGLFPVQGQIPVGILPDGASAQPVQHAVLGGHLAGEDGGPGGGAHRTGAVKILEADPLRRHAVQRRRHHIRVAVGGQTPGALVVREQENDIFGFHTFALPWAGGL